MQPTSAPADSTARREQAGFGLAEALVALALCALLLLTGLALFAVDTQARRRLAAHAAAEQALELAYEQLRAGLLPLASGGVPIDFAADGAALALAVEPTDTDDLYRIRLIASYRATGRSFRRVQEALLWRP